MQKKRKAGWVEALEARRLLSGVPTPAHVVVVIEENHSYDEIIGSSQASYINSLAGQGALFNSSFAVDHPSQPNYLAIFSGSEQGISDDNGPVGPFSGPNLGSELIAAGKTFGGYSEDLPYVGAPDLTSGPYAQKHNPWSDFSNVPTNDNMPFSSFPSDFTTLPTVSFVIPNLNNDMHDGTVQQGDQWLQANMSAYATWAQSHNSLLIVAWDEDDSSQSNQIPTIIYGQGVNPGTYGETIDHYSVLRTIEDMYGLPWAGNSATATPITDVWLTASDSITGTGNNDQFTLVQDVDQQHIDWTMGAATGQVAINDANGLTINDNSGNNFIVLDNSGGNPLPNRLNLNGNFTVKGLQGTNPLAGTQLDINRSTVYLSYAGSSDPISTIRTYLKNGYNGGAWNGTPTASTGVITSSAAAGNSLRTTAIGYVDSADGSGFNTTTKSIKLQYTLYGDTSLVGAVGFNDFTRLTQHYNLSGAGWDGGDFNYDGTVNSSDFNLFSRTYGTSLGTQAAPAIAAPAAADPTTGAATTAAVDSPSSLTWWRTKRRR